jgi:hypothetical protein
MTYCYNKQNKTKQTNKTKLTHINKAIDNGDSNIEEFF